MVARPLPLLLGSLLLSTACIPPVTPPECKCQAGFACVDGACQPLACTALDETDCLGRTDCQANYTASDRCVTPSTDGSGDSRCGGTGNVFLGCQNKACNPVTCDLYCEHGMARDSSGCEVCACAPAYCGSDAECLPNETCAYPATECPANAKCMAPQGVCTPKTDPGCSSDAECKAGETCVFPQIDCPPDAFCAPARGSCKPAGACTSDADCGVGRRCVFVAMDGASSVCVDRTPCTDGSECGWGETCAMDPNDPCVNNVCLTFAPAQTFCIPTCDMLGEADCLARRDCEAMYEGPRCGNDPTPAYFTGCKPAACPPVMCNLWCEKGYKVDERGCNTCQCDDSCLSDADCLPGQACVMPMVDCAPGMDCPAVKGVCNTIDPGCQSDAECAAGETCVFTSTYCLGADDGSNQGGGKGGCVGPAYGTCVKVQTPCTDDSQCKPGQVCSLPELVCPPDVVCPQPTGTCVDVQPVGCTDDSQCLPGQRCNYDPMVNCGGMANCIGECVSAECRSDADCRAGESCIFLMDACPPGDPACPNAGICNKVEQRFCAADSDCAAGQKCLPDPTDPCNQPNVDCFAPGRNICQ